MFGKKRKTSEEGNYRLPDLSSGRRVMNDIVPSGARPSQPALRRMIAEEDVSEPRASKETPQAFAKRGVLDALTAKVGSATRGFMRRREVRRKLSDEIAKQPPADRLTKEERITDFFSPIIQKTHKAFSATADRVSKLSPEERKLRTDLYNAGHSFWRRRSTIQALFAVFCAVAGGLYLVNAFSYVTLQISPKQEFFDADSNLKGSLVASADLPVEIMKFSKAKTISGTTSGVREMNERAKGVIVVYNAYSSESQILVKRTRFETTDGKIYRIGETITVPGAKIEDGKISPSSIEVEVSADQPGPDYNIGLADFTIPGFKSTARYSKFYGRSKTAMTGGYVGTKRVVAEKDLNALRANLESGLKAEILEEYKNRVPEGFILLDGAYEITFGELASTPKLHEEGEGVSAALMANFQGLLIRKDGISDALSKARLAELSGTKNAKIVNIDSLNKEISKIDFVKGELNLRISGRAHLVQVFDEDKLRQDFIKGEQPLEMVFASYPEIEKAEVVFSPSWWPFVPDDPERIKISIIEVSE